jgi:hypothetical protein
MASVWLKLSYGIAPSVTPVEMERSPRPWALRFQKMAKLQHSGSRHVLIEGLSQQLLSNMVGKQGGSPKRAAIPAPRDEHGVAQSWGHLNSEQSQQRQGLRRRPSAPGVPAWERRGAWHQWHVETFGRAACMRRHSSERAVHPERAQKRRLRWSTSSVPSIQDRKRRKTACLEQGQAAHEPRT